MPAHSPAAAALAQSGKRGAQAGPRTGLRGPGPPARGRHARGRRGPRDSSPDHLRVAGLQGPAPSLLVHPLTLVGPSRCLVPAWAGSRSLVPLLISSRVPAWAGAAAWLAGRDASGRSRPASGSGGTSLGGEIARGRQSARDPGGRAGAPLDRGARDTKAQGHSMAGRLMAVWFSCWRRSRSRPRLLRGLGGPLPELLAVGRRAAGGDCGGACRRGAGSTGSRPGARDNGSGLARRAHRRRGRRDPASGS